MHSAWRREDGRRANEGDLSGDVTEPCVDEVRGALGAANSGNARLTCSHAPIE